MCTVLVSSAVFLFYVVGFFNNDIKAFAYKGSDIETIPKRTGSFEALRGRYFGTSTPDLGFRMFSLLPEKQMRQLLLCVAVRPGTSISFRLNGRCVCVCVCASLPCIITSVLSSCSAFIGIS